MPAPLLPLGHKLESAPLLTAPQTLNLARDLGVELALDGGELRAVGGRNAITELAPHIRACKPELMRLLSVQAANDGTPAPAHLQRTCNAPATAGNVAAPGQHHADTVPTPEPEPTDWLVLDRAYQAHHFKCAVCIAAGRGTRYGQRCGVGAALWASYDHASRNTPPPWHKPKGKK